MTLLIVMIAKAAIDLTVAAILYSNPSMCVMFFGFALADVGALMIAVKH